MPHMLAQEHMSAVDALRYGTARTEVTLAAALAAIGSTERMLMLTDTGDGVWTLGANVTIPVNVLLLVPVGVTLSGPGNLTIIGGLHTLRWPVHVGPGSIIQEGTTQGPWFSNLFAGSLIVTGFSGVLPPPPATTPIGTTGWVSNLTNNVSAGAIKVSAGSLQNIVGVTLTADTLAGSAIGALNSYAYLDTGGHHFIGEVAAHTVVSYIYGTGGVLDTVTCSNMAIYPLGTTTIASATCLHIYGLIPFAAPGIVQAYTGIFVSDIPPAHAPQLGYNIRTQLNKSDDVATELRYNLYAEGTAPNYLASALAIGSIPTQTATYALFVNGTAQKPGGSTWTDSSSRALKSDIAPLTGALALLLGLKGTSYRWVEPTHARLLPGRQMGFIAEDVQTVFPEWVEETPNGELLLTERGGLALTVEALRELEARIRALEGSPSCANE